MTTKNDQLIAVRDQLKSLLDSYQIRDPGMVTFQSALVDLQTAIDMPDPAPAVIEQPVVGTAAVVDGVLAGLAGLVAAVNSVEADTAQLRADTQQIISNTTPVAA
jgi:hypothetical protein